MISGSAVRSRVGGFVLDSSGEGAYSADQSTVIDLRVRVRAVSTARAFGYIQRVATPTHAYGIFLTETDWIDIIRFQSLSRWKVHSIIESTNFE